MPKGNKPTASPFSLAKGVALLIPNDKKIPVPSQLIWIRHMAGDGQGVMTVVDSLKELEALLPASCVWVASPLYVTKELRKTIGETPLFVASLPGLEGKELDDAIDIIQFEYRSQKLLSNAVSRNNALKASAKAAENFSETAANLESILRKLWKEEGATLKNVAQQLTNMRIPTSTGADVWHATQVRRLLMKLGLY